MREDYTKNPPISYRAKITTALTFIFHHLKCIGLYDAESATDYDGCSLNGMTFKAGANYYVGFPQDENPEAR